MPAPVHVQLVDRLDQGAFSSAAPGQLTYQGLYKLVAKALYRAHVEGKLKREIIQVGFVVRTMCGTRIGLLFNRSAV